MKQIFKFLVVAVFASIFTLIGSNYYMETKDITMAFKQQSPITIPISNSNKQGDINSFIFR